MSSVAPDFRDIAEELYELPGIHSIRWGNFEAAHSVHIDCSGASASERLRITSVVQDLVKKHPERLLIVHVDEEKYATR